MKQVSMWCASAAVILCSGSAAKAELVYGIVTANGTSGSSIVSFDSASPGTTSATVALTGVTDLRGIDVRPANGALYGLGYDTTTTTGQLYLINPVTGVATAVGGALALPNLAASTRISIDFNPVVDRLRIVGGTGGNYRVNPNNGTIAATDTTLSYDGSTGLSGVPFVVDVAYSNNVAGATSTTLFAYEFNNDRLTTIGSAGGAPTSPNTGVVFSVGGTGGPSAFSGDVGFDISGATGVGYISLDDAPSPTTADEFYTVNLGTGALTLVGTSPFDLLDIAVAAPVVPEPATLALVPALGTLLVRRRTR